MKVLLFSGGDPGVVARLSGDAPEGLTGLPGGETVILPVARRRCS